ncbi:MAG: hypothetical protein AAGM38_01665 [Pseudomonadota bacterium]
MIEVFARSAASGEILPDHRFEFKDYAKAIAAYRAMLFDDALRIEGARIALLDDWDVRRSRACRMADADDLAREEAFFAPAPRERRELVDA